MSNVHVARSRRLLGFVFAWCVTAICVCIAAVACTACDLFVGPVTEKGSDFFVTCRDGKQKCDVTISECSATLPSACIPKWQYYGASRDAGRE